MNGVFAEDLHGSESLSDRELFVFAAKGWIGPFPLLSKRGVEAACAARNASTHLFRGEGELAECRAANAFDDLLWFKSLHARVPLFAEIASHPALVCRLNQLLGTDVMLWGSSVTVREPGQVHRWHVDVEHRMWRGITAFIGLENIAPGSSLKVISGSHLVGTMPQELRVTDDQSATAAAKTVNVRDPVVVEVDLGPGQFFLFDGPLWHGSQNRTSQTRMAVLAQYARPDARVAIPLTSDQPIRRHPSRPPCLMVSGTDRFAINAMLQPT